MPYFPALRTLYIHIPRTGGTSVERYLMARETNTIVRGPAIRFPEDFLTADWVALLKSRSDALYTTDATGGNQQHFTVCQALSCLPQAVVDALERIVVTVRNPYTRLVSELNWLFGSREGFRRLVEDDAIAPAERHRLIDGFVNEIAATLEHDGYGAFDNHLRPQHHFVEGTPDHLTGRVTVMRTECLSQEMHDAGYPDFVERENTSACRIACGRLVSPGMDAFVRGNYAVDFERFRYATGHGALPH